MVRFLHLSVSCRPGLCFGNAPLRASVEIPLCGSELIVRIPVRQ